MVPGGIGITFGSRTILTITDGANVRAASPEADEVLADGVGSFFAQGEIVLGSAPGIGVAGNDDFGVGVIAEIVGELVQLGTFLGLNGKAVVGEENGFGF